MAISNYGDLKAELSSYLFHQRFVARYDNCTLLFEATANSRLRVLPMEHVVNLTTVAGEVALPSDYLAWRTIKPTPRPYEDELEYVHPAYLTTITRVRYPAIFTIEADTFKARPVDDTADGYEFHYYRKIPTLTASDDTTNWMLTEYPNAYLFGVMTEMAALGRNLELAQLYKARRDEIFLEIKNRYAATTGATSPSVRTAEYF